MGVLDWLGPLNFGAKRRGWDALPVPAEQKQASWTQQDMGAAIRINTLIHGPGATELLGQSRRGDGNSAVFACLVALATAYTEAPLAVYRRISTNEREAVFEHPLQAFLDRPNPVFSMRKILWWVTWCKSTHGNAFLRKLRSGNEESGNTVELWPVSPTRIEPRTQSGSGNFIDVYRYHVRPGKYEDISPLNIIHLRNGLDDQDHRLGCSPLKRLIREISSDERATKYADTLLSNLAVNGLSLEFPPDAGRIDQATAEELKARIQAAYSGDNLGSVAVLSPGSKLVSHGFSPEQMSLKILHDVPETRITAVMRVPAIVAGLGVGLTHTIYNNFSQAREQFSEDTILPMYHDDDDQFTHDLVPDFSSDRNIVIAHDISQMRSLQEDEDKKANRLKVYVEAGILDIDEARAEIGREPRPSLAAPAKRRLLTLPTRERKSAEDLVNAFEESRAARTAAWEAEIRSFLEEQKGRVTRALRAGADDPFDLVAEAEGTLLGQKLEPLQLSLLDDVTRLVVSELGIQFELDDPATRRFLAEAGERIVGITQTTRTAVQDALIEGQLNGESIPQLARRIRELPEFGSKRAVTVARSELGHAQNTAALASYRASGVVVGVRVHDGTDDDEECRAMNGRVFDLDHPPATLQHPRCRRALAPILDADELVRSA